MDLQKLEKLSCLKLEDHQKKEVEKSLEGVFLMMEQLELVPIISIEKVEDDKTIFREQSTREDFIKRQERQDGLHLEDGVFLAPKVIKK